MKKLFPQKIILSTVIALLFAGGFFFSNTHKAEAILAVPVNDYIGNLALADIVAATDVTATADSWLELKENILDGIAYGLINAIIAQLADSLTQWINSGFQGSPGFITHPENFFLNVANEASGQLINDLGANFLCEPFSFDLKLGFNLGLDIPKLRKKKVQCTLIGALNNAQSFAAYTAGDFDVGGMPGWISISQPQNNPYGAFIYASAEIQAEGVRQKELSLIQSNWNNGFKSVTDKVNKAIKTPGVVVEKQLNDSLDSGKRRIEAADEINEIIGALLGQLLSSLTNGLNGESSPDVLVDYTNLPICPLNAITMPDGKPCQRPSTDPNRDTTLPNCPLGKTDIDGKPCKLVAPPPKDVPPDTNGPQLARNLAFSGIPTQSNLYSDDILNGPKNAVNGSFIDLCNAYPAASCTGGGFVNAPPWWQIDLVSKYHVDTVRISVARLDFGSLDGSYLITSEKPIPENLNLANPPPNVKVTLIPNQNRNDWVIEMPVNINAQFVRIQRGMFNGVGVYLGEVEVMGRDIIPETTASLCSDKMDNDFNGLTDGADPSCAIALDKPTADSLSVSTSKNTPVSIPLKGNGIPPLTYAIITGPSQGNASLSNGTVLYTPNRNYTGPDSFTYTITSGNNKTSDPATISITVGGNLPILTANPISVSVTAVGATITLQGNCQNCQDPITYEIVTGPAHGSFTFGPFTFPGAVSGNSVAYVPTLNFTGSDSFTYRSISGNQSSAIATVFITVQGIVQIPFQFPTQSSTFQNNFPAFGAQNAIDSDMKSAASTGAENNPTWSATLTRKVQLDRIVILHNSTGPVEVYVDGNRVALIGPNLNTPTTISLNNVSGQFIELQAHFGLGNGLITLYDIKVFGN